MNMEAADTNLEAADRIKKLRDLSGLIVIDFIDMLNFYNKRTVEKKCENVLEKIGLGSKLEE